ncbi:hypothetical protein BC834DRAFT_96723 [Gloeopeniophorella convolvens]|nr:hypothetical protein BC834DRAFT_96723 [Gloeopeniophorella convolvens]
MEGLPCVSNPKKTDRNSGKSNYVKRSPTNARRNLNVVLKDFTHPGDRQRRCCYGLDDCICAASVYRRNQELALTNVMRSTLACHCLEACAKRRRRHNLQPMNLLPPEAILSNTMVYLFLEVFIPPRLRGTPRGRAARGSQITRDCKTYTRVKPLPLNRGKMGETSNINTDDRIFTGLVRWRSGPREPAL